MKWIALALMVVGFSLALCGILRMRRGRRSFVAYAMTVVIVTTTAAVAGAAGLNPRVSAFLDVNAKAVFDPKPTCAWTDAAEVTLTWDDDPAATSYDVLRSLTVGAGYASIANVDDDTTEYADTTVNPGAHPIGEYYYRIQANKPGGDTTGRPSSSTTRCPGYITTLAGGGGTTAPVDETPQSPVGLAIADGQMVVTDRRGMVRSVDLDTDAETLLAGAPTRATHGDGGPADLANFELPAGTAIDSVGNIYVVDSDANRVRMIDTDGDIFTFAGTGDACADPTDACGDGAAANAAQLKDPFAIAIDSDDNVFIADTGDNRVRRVDAVSGNISTYAGTGDNCPDPVIACGDGDDAVDAELHTPKGLAFDPDDNLYIADTGDHRVRVVHAADDTIDAFAGDGDAPRFDADGGLASEARIGGPNALFIDDDGAMYIVQGTRRIRRVASGLVDTVAGTGGNSISGDGGLATEARLGNTQGIVGDDLGNLWVSTIGGVRIITAEGRIGLVAGDYSTCAAATNPCGDGGLATDAKIDLPRGLARDDVGNLYIADYGQNKIRKVSPSGIITTFAGTGTACDPLDACGDGGAATSATLNGPHGIFWTGSALLVAEYGSNRIRKITTTGAARDPDTISTIAGTGVAAFSGDGGLATAAELNHPKGVYQVDPTHIYVADTENGRVRVFSEGGNISTFAGDGSFGSSGDGGAPTAAAIAFPTGLAEDDGAIYITDELNRVRVVDGGVIDTFVGDGNVDTYTPNALAVDSQLSAPTGIAWDPWNGALWITDPQAHRVFYVFFGYLNAMMGDGVGGYLPGDTTWPMRLDEPVGVVPTGTGIVYIADQASNRIAIYDNAGPSSEYGGTGDAEFLDAGDPESARFGPLGGIAQSSDGDTYVTDPLNNRVRKIAANGAVTTVAGDGDAPAWGGDGGLSIDAQLGDASRVARDASGNTYVLEGHRVRKFGADGFASTIAGGTAFGFAGEGTAAVDAKLWSPDGLAVAADGSIYVADTQNHRVRKIWSNGEITTVAGDGDAGFGGDGGAATSADLNTPRGIALDGNGDLLIADSGNHRIRKVTFSNGHITTIAGTGGQGYSGDGDVATDAELSAPSDIAYDSVDDEIYFFDRGNVVIRRIAAGDIDTVAGTGTPGNSGADGAVGTTAGISNSGFLAYSAAADSVFWSDSTYHRIRQLKDDLTLWSVAGDTAGGFGDDGDATNGDFASVRFTGPRGIAVTDWGSGAPDLVALFVADSGNARIRELALDSQRVESVVGNNFGATWGGDGGPTVNAQLDRPVGIAISDDDLIHVTTADGRVRRFLDGGNITTLAGEDDALVFPIGIAIGATTDDVYVSDMALNQVFKLDLVGHGADVFAGTGVASSTGDGGPAVNATLNQPTGLAWRGTTLYVADTFGAAVRAIDGDGDIDTIAGDGSVSASGDGGAATAAGLGLPLGVAFDDDGNMFISAITIEPEFDVRRVDVDDQKISTVARSPIQISAFFGDMGGALGAGIALVSGLVVDADGNLLMAQGGIGGADMGGARVRHIVGPF